MENIQLSNILHIQEASKQGKLVMFVGAGVSADSGVPMRSELIQGLKKELPYCIKIQEVIKNISRTLVSR